MKAFVKVKKNRLNTGYHSLSQKMWGIKTDSFFANRLGPDDALNHLTDFGFSLLYSDFNPKWDTVKTRWNASGIYLHETHTTGVISVFSEFDFELPITQKAFFNLIAYLADNLDGTISEDNQQSWTDLVNFQKKHHDIMTADFDRLLTDSIQIGSKINPVDEPSFYELSYDIY